MEAQIEEDGLTLLSPAVVPLSAMLDSAVHAYVALQISGENLERKDTTHRTTSDSVFWSNMLARTRMSHVDHSC